MLHLAAVGATRAAVRLPYIIVPQYLPPARAPGMVIALPHPSAAGEPSRDIPIVP
jgi:hypothetical protein